MIRRIITAILICILATQASSICNSLDFGVCAKITVNKVFLAVGEELIMTCQVLKGKPSDDVVIMKGILMIANQTRPNNSTVSVTINNVTKEDSGTYYCCVNNCDTPSDDWDKQWISVAAPFSFACESINMAPLKCSWNNNWGKDDRHMHLHWNLSFAESATRSCTDTTFTNQLVTVDDDVCSITGNRSTCIIAETFDGYRYKFQLNMTTHYGTQTYYFLVCYDYHIVNVIPNHYASLRSLSATSAELQWTMPTIGFQHGMGCQVTYQSEWGVHFNKTLVYESVGGKIPIYSKYYELTDLHPYTRYRAQIRCFVTGSVYRGEAVNLNFTTLQSVPMSGPSMTNTSYVKCPMGDNGVVLLFYVKTPSRYYTQGEVTNYSVVQDGNQTVFPVTTTIQYPWVKHDRIEIWESNKVGKSYTTIDAPSEMEYTTVIDEVTVEKMSRDQYLVNVTYTTKSKSRTNLIYHYCEGKRFRQFTNIVNCTGEYNFIRSNSSQMTITTRSRDVYFAVSADYPEPSDGLHWQDCVYTYDTTGIELSTPRSLTLQSNGVSTATLLVPDIQCNGTQPKPYHFIVYWKDTGSTSDTFTRHALVLVENVQPILTGLNAKTSYSAWYQVVYRNNTKSGNSSVLTFVTLDESTVTTLDDPKIVAVLAVTIVISVLICMLFALRRMYRYYKIPFPIETPGILTSDKVKTASGIGNQKNHDQGGKSKEIVNTTDNKVTVTNVALTSDRVQGADNSDRDTTDTVTAKTSTAECSGNGDALRQSSDIAADTVGNYKSVGDNYVRMLDEKLTPLERSSVSDGTDWSSVQDYMKFTFCERSHQTSGSSAELFVDSTLQRPAEKPISNVETNLPNVEDHIQKTGNEKVLPYISVDTNCYDSTLVPIEDDNYTRYVKAGLGVDGIQNMATGIAQRFFQEKNLYREPYTYPNPALVKQTQATESNSNRQIPSFIVFKGINEYPDNTCSLYKASEEQNETANTCTPSVHIHHETLSQNGYVRCPINITTN